MSKFMIKGGKERPEYPGRGYSHTRQHSVGCRSAHHRHCPGTRRRPDLNMCRTTVDVSGNLTAHVGMDR